jgi:TM2 domain-containing membrane protein YozV
MTNFIWSSLLSFIIVVVLHGNITSTNNYVVLLDESGSMWGYQDKVSKIIWDLSHEQGSHVISFGDHKLKDRGIVKGFIQYKPLGNTPIFEAFAFVLAMVPAPEQVIVITDGKIDAPKSRKELKIWQQIQDSKIEIEYRGME